MCVEDDVVELFAVFLRGFGGAGFTTTRVEQKFKFRLNLVDTYQTDDFGGEKRFY